MKKAFILICVICLSFSTAYAVEQGKDMTQVQKQIQQTKRHREVVFEKKLELTEAQKLKAREIRKEGHAKLKPIIEEIRSKKQEAEMVKRSRMA